MGGDLRGGLRQVLELLHLNSDALALESPPEQSLPSPSAISTMPISVLRSALAWAMSLVAEVCVMHTYTHTYMLTHTHTWAMSLVAEVCYDTHTHTHRHTHAYTQIFH